MRALFAIYFGLIQMIEWGGESLQEEQATPLVKI